MDLEMTLALLAIGFGIGSALGYVLGVQNRKL